MVYAQGNWQTRGLGWIPDLPDVTDPSIQTVVGETLRVQSQADVGAVEEAVTLLLELLKERPEFKATDLKAIKTKLFGETRFPAVKVYKILRKNSNRYDNKVARQDKEIIQLRLALYLIYQKTIDSQQDSQTDNTVDQRFFSVAFTPTREILAGSGPKLVHWLQNPIFDDELEKLVIDFQSYMGLIGDGIVGLRTYTAIQEELSDQKGSSARDVQLLCPLSLIPFNVLKEIFQHLTYLWLYGKFKTKIDLAFQQFQKAYLLDALMLEQVEASWHELDSFVREGLHNIGAVPRGSKVSSRDDRDDDSIDDAFIKHLKVELPKFCQALFEKNRQLLSCHGQDLSDFQVTDYSKKTDEITETLRALIEFRVNELSDLPIDSSNQENEDFTSYRSDLIYYSYDNFVIQFQLWFHIIEPFVSAIFQVLSPLASFDNFKQAIKNGFENLESCFQFHQLVRESSISPYKNLLTQYSPAYLSDKIDELEAKRESVTFLFKEALAKIERTRKENLNFREDIFDLLEQEWKYSPSPSYRQGQLLSEDFFSILEKRVAKNYPDYKEQDWKELWSNFVRPTAENIYHSITKAENPNKQLREQKKDVKIFISFFQFLEDILKQYRGISEAKSCEKEEQQGNVSYQPIPRGNIQGEADLRSLLTAKKELFEINLSSQNQVTEAGTTDAKGDRAPLFLQPMQLPLPVNSNLLELALEKTQKGVRSYFFLPGIVDLSYWCSPIEDQGAVNACTAFAGIALVEYFAQKRYGKYANLSARFLYKAARNLMHRLDDQGASVRRTMEALVLFGVPPEAIWPWSETDFNEEPPAFCYTYAQSYQALKYFRLDTTRITSKELLLFQIKAVLAAGLPCIFGFTVYSSFYKERSLRRGQIPLPSARDQIVGGHSAVAVGYNDYIVIERIDGQPTQPGAILIRNSWGPTWGKGGYGWIPYEYVLEGLTADWWSLLKSEWFDGGAFGLGAVDPGKERDKPTD